MFELPEMTVLAKQMKDTLADKTVQKGSLGNSPHKFVWYNRTHKEFDELTRKKIIGNIIVRGRWMLIELNPGYILVQMQLDDETWHIVNRTAKVSGFLGGREKPTPISDEEAERILNRMEAGKMKPQPKYYFESGDEIRVIDGPFTNFNGTVEEVNPEKGKIKVLVSIFGRSTPVELEFVQVTKV